jgi:hypothetical protein
MAYVLDTSALIGGWHRTYPPDVLPGLWENLDALCTSGGLHVPYEVVLELKAQEDDLSAWVMARAGDLVVETTRAVAIEARAILNDHPQLTMPGTGRGAADPFVIAVAAIRGCPVVTEERGGSAAKPRIPYVCNQRQVQVMDMLGVIRSEGWTFR